MNGKVKSLPGIGTKCAEHLATLGILTVDQMLDRWPTEEDLVMECSISKELNRLKVYLVKGWKAANKIREESQQQPQVQQEQTKLPPAAVEQAHLAELVTSGEEVSNVTAPRVGRKNHKEEKKERVYNQLTVKKEPPTPEKNNDKQKDDKVKREAVPSQSSPIKRELSVQKNSRLEPKVEKQLLQTSVAQADVPPYEKPHKEVEELDKKSIINLISSSFVTTAIDYLSKQDMKSKKVSIKVEKSMEIKFVQKTVVYGKELLQELLDEQNCKRKSEFRFCLIKTVPPMSAKSRSSPFKALQLLYYPKTDCDLPYFVTFEDKYSSVSHPQSSDMLFDRHKYQKWMKKCSVFEKADRLARQFPQSTKRTGHAVYFAAFKFKFNEQKYYFHYIGSVGSRESDSRIIQKRWGEHISATHKIATGEEDDSQLVHAMFAHCGAANSVLMIIHVVPSSSTDKYHDMLRIESEYIKEFKCFKPSRGEKISEEERKLYFRGLNQKR